MSFKSLNNILGVLQEQSRWQQPFQHLCKCWPEVVGAAVAGHTRPLSIGRSTLWVATSSAAWAQNLTFERQRILEKLNQRLPSPLVDIRFSTAQWQLPKSTPPASAQAQTQLRQHPSWLVDTPSRNDERPIQNPNTAFQHWAKVMQERSYGLPLCPQCHCPTPPGEIQRWAVCSICATREW